MMKFIYWTKFLSKKMKFTGQKSREFLAAVALGEEVLDFSTMSDNLSVDFSSSRASVVACPAVERRVDLAVEFAHVVFVKNLDGICLAAEAVFFVARLASHRILRFCKKFVHS